MPWVKATPNMRGMFEISMDEIAKGKVYDSAEDCMDHFRACEKDSSFGPIMTCRPVFFPLNDDELMVFKSAFAEGKANLEDHKKSAKMDELAGTLIDFIRTLKTAVEKEAR